MKNGSNPKKVIAGKKCIGTARLGNNSGESMSNGRLNVSGPKILIKEKTTIIMFIHPFNLSTLNLSIIKYAMAISIHPNIEPPAIDPRLITLLKSVNVIC